jgi:hypothetical protein
MQFKGIKLATAVALIGGAAVLRILPHVPNVSPIAAVALFGGFYFATPWAAIAVVLAALGLSDAVLGAYDPRIMAMVYAGLLVPVAFRFLFARGPSLVRAAAGSLGASAVFFAVSNFAVWAFSGMYQHSMAGLAACFTMALPFFQNTVVGDLAFTFILFGSYAAVRAIAQRREVAATRNAEARA